MRNIYIFAEDLENVQQIYRYLHGKLIMDAAFKCTYPHRIEVEGWRIHINVEDPLYLRKIKYLDLFYAKKLNTREYLERLGGYRIDNIDEISKFVKRWEQL